MQENALIDGEYNVFIGRDAGCTNTTGSSNIAVGDGVPLPSATVVISCVLVGSVPLDCW